MPGGKYVPPALRGKANNSQTEETCPGTKLYTIDEVRTSFGHSPNANANDGDRNASATAPEEPAAEVESHSRDHGTLNVSYDEPDKLAYFILFHDAHPFWETKLEVFCKTNLDLLPEPSSLIVEHDKPVYNPSFPVFTQRKLPYYDSTRGRILGFDGYYGIKSVRYLEPQSRELVEYTQAKFGNKPRGPDAWKSSLSMRWAVITLVRDESRKDEAPPVQIVQRSVNELLLEARG